MALSRRPLPPEQQEAAPLRDTASAPIYRLARRLEGYSFGLVPEYLGIAEGLRAASAVAVMILAALLSGQGLLLWAAFGAFWCCLCDPGGRDSLRLRVIGSFVVFGTLAAFLGAASAGISPWLAGALLVPLIFLPALGGVFGPGGAQAGALICVVGGVSVGFPGDITHAFELSGAFLLGGTWALIFTFTIWRLHPQAPARRALSSVFLRLEEMNSAIIARIGSGQGLGSAEPEYRRALRAAIERSRGVILGIGNGRGPFLTQLNLADRVFAAMIALDHAVSRPLSAPRQLQARDLMNRIATLLAHAEAQTLRRDPDPGRLAQSAQALQQAATQAGGDYGRAVAHIAQTLGQLAQTLALHPEQDSPSIARARGSFGGFGSFALGHPIPQQIRLHAIRLTLAVVATYAICVGFGMHYLYWATMATIVVLQPSLSTTWPRMLERVLGSIAGGLFAAGVIAIVPDRLVLLAVIFPVAAATIAFKRVNYTLFTGCVGALFVLVTELLTPHDGIALARAVNNALGSLVAFLAGVTLWPGRGEARFGDVLAEALRANLAYAAGALSQQGLPESVDALRRQAGVASNDAEIVRQRKILEGRRRADRLDQAGALLGALRTLAGAVTIRALNEAEPDPARAAAMAQTAEEFSAQVRSPARSEALALPSGEPNDDLEAALAGVGARLALYLRD